MADASVSKYRAALAAEMRLRGFDYESIAKDLGYADKSGAWRAVQRSLASRSQRAGDALWGRQMTDLDLLQERSWPAAMAGDRRAIANCVRAIETRSRIALGSL